MDELISKLGDYKLAIKEAITNKYGEINPGTEGIVGDNILEYAKYIRDYLTTDFERYFTTIGYEGIPEELITTVAGQVAFNISNDKSALSQSMFVGANFTGNLDNNRRCFLLFTDDLSGQQRLNYLRSLKDVYVLFNVEDLTSYKESVINPYWLFRETQNIENIYCYLNMSNIGYTISVNGTVSGGDYFFTAQLSSGNNVTAAKAPYLKTLYMKNIHRAYNFSGSPLSMESVLYCISNAQYDEDYANNEEGNYKFTLMGSAYTDEEKSEIQSAVATRAAELGDNGLNMEIVFA